MITEQDLQEAIAECEGVRNPTSGTCLKLAAYYTIQDKLFKEKTEQKTEAPYRYSFANEPERSAGEGIVNYVSDTEFSQAIHGRDSLDVWPVIDELMSVLQATNLRLYNGVMRKLN